MADYATLGVVLEDGRGDRFALTCAHVAAQNDDILQPSQRDSKKATVIGKSVLTTTLSPCSVSDACNDKSGVPTNELDLSLIRIDPCISSKQEVLDIGTLNGVVPIAALSCGQTVEVMGRSCKHKTLQLGDFHVFRRHEHNGQYYCYKNMVRVESPYGATDVIKGGDSGAPVCITSGGGKGLCGMIPDFRFECGGANLLILTDAFIYAGSDARNQARRICTPWVKSKTGPFSYVSTDF